MALDQHQREGRAEHADSQQRQEAIGAGSGDHGGADKGTHDAAATAHGQRHGGTGSADGRRVDIGTQGVQQHLGGTHEQAVDTEAGDQHLRVLLGIDTHHGHRHDTCQQRHDDHRDARAEAVHDQGTQQRTDHATDVVGGQALAGQCDRQAFAGQHRRQPAVGAVQRQHDHEEGQPQADGVTRIVAGEQALEADGLLGVGGSSRFQGVGELGVGRGRALQAVQQLDQLLPALALAGQETWRFRQEGEQHQAEGHRDGAANPEQRAPAVSRQHPAGKQAGQHATQREADDGDGHRHGA